MTPKALLALHTALISLIRYLLDDRTGGVFGAAVDMLAKETGARGVMAYRLENAELVMVAENGLPRRAKAWLARLPVDDRPWFVAQRAVISLRGEVDSQLADSRMGHSIRPTLEAAGWRTLACAPIRVGRTVHGAIVIAGGGQAFERTVLHFLEAVCGVLALSSERESILQRAREDKLRETKTAQLATMGLLSATVSRDLATPLGSMQLQLEAQETHLRALRQQIAEGGAHAMDALEEIEDIVADLGEALRRTQGIAARLLAFARETKPEPIDLSIIVQAGVKLLREGIEARGILLVVEGDHESMMVDGREEALQMLVVQLLLYASDECEASKVRGPKIAMTLERQGDSCILAMASSGRGAQLSGAQIFDGLVRDKGTQAAVGLELARQTAVAHGGGMEIGPSELGGARIKVTLPWSAGRDDSQQIPASLNRRRKVGEKRIIVWIDEDEAFVQTMSRLITTHETLIAGSIGEATEVLQELDHLPELVVCNVALPDGYGVDLHCEVDIDLASRFAFVTGGVVSADVVAYLKSSGCPTLIKPITIAEIERLLPAKAPAAAEALAAAVNAPPRTDEGSVRRARRFQERRQATTVQEVPRPPERDEDGVLTGDDAAVADELESELEGLQRDEEIDEPW
jgi:signal transduction histidine kinase/ActR/RegA family two-component response regulator